MVNLAAPRLSDAAAEDDPRPRRDFPRALSIRAGPIRIGVEKPT